MSAAIRELVREPDFDTPPDDGEDAALVEVMAQAAHAQWVRRSDRWNVASDRVREHWRAEMRAAIAAARASGFTITQEAF